MSVNAFLEKIGITGNERTNPVVIFDILKNDMKLDDFEPAKGILANLLNEEQPLHETIDTVRRSVAEKHPAIQQFCEQALDGRLIPDLSDAGKAIVSRMLNHIAILDALTLAFAADKDLLKQVFTHFVAKRKAFGIREGTLRGVIDAYKVTGALFASVKIVSVDLGVRQAISILDAGIVDARFARKTGRIVSINILEAGAIDLCRRYIGNARVALDLARPPYGRLWVDPETKYAYCGHTRNWASLYHTWNLAFVTGNTKYFHVIYPPLLIPCLLDGVPESYIYIRAISLWLSLNFYLFTKIDGKLPYVLPNRRAMATLWGRINSAYRLR